MPSFSYGSLCNLVSKTGTSKHDIIGIESVADSSGDVSSGKRDGTCVACETMVLRMQNQCEQNMTREHILRYVNDLSDQFADTIGDSDIDCGKVASMPNISFTLGGKDFVLTPQEYLIKDGEGDGTRCVSGFMSLDIPTSDGLLCFSTQSPR
ncbi:unnamed protein product [Lactuca virosa]|uniref:Peptidase A1 domain-containing protein n=1 Tax=Lactuca virosa TaxID=75947 RepID=A0AAU9NQ63_9ASTR|nr:unnamed protein product [Lactuca virosa]